MSAMCVASTGIIGELHGVADAKAGVCNEKNERPPFTGCMFDDPRYVVIGKRKRRRLGDDRALERLCRIIFHPAGVHAELEE